MSCFCHAIRHVDNGRYQVLAPVVVAGADAGVANVLVLCVGVLLPSAALAGIEPDPVDEA